MSFVRCDIRSDSRMLYNSAALPIPFVEVPFVHYPICPSAIHVRHQARPLLKRLAPIRKSQS